VRLGIPLLLSAQLGNGSAASARLQLALQEAVFKQPYREFKALFHEFVPHQTFAPKKL
jgi:hypothetical protein